MGEGGEVPQEVLPIEEKASEKVGLLEDVLCLPPEVVGHIVNQTDSRGQIVEARQGLYMLTKELFEEANRQLGSRFETTPAEKSLKQIATALRVSQEKAGSEKTAEQMRVDGTLTADIQAIVFKGTTMKNALNHVNVDFPTVFEHKINIQRGKESMIGLRHSDTGELIKEVPFGDKLRVIMDAEAAR